MIGLIGNPTKHSRSPHMHNSAFEKLGLDYVYLCFDVQDGDLERAIDAFKLFQARGFNVTFPHKQKILAYLDDISEDARIIGAINTAKIDPSTGKITGYNTDGRGIIASFDEKRIKYRNEKVILCGVGGAGRAIAISLAYNGVGELILKEINKTLAAEIKETIERNISGAKVRIIADDDITVKNEMKDATLFINATPLGMESRGGKCVVSSPDVFHPGVFVYDIVYDPRETLLMKYARQAGCETTNGINMMLWQGAIAFKIWFGVDMPLDYVRQELFEQ